MIKKIIRKITEICVALSVMIVPVISTTGLGNTTKVYARLDDNKDNQVTWSMLGTLNDGTNAAISKTVMNNLFGVISGGAGNTYE